MQQVITHLPGHLALTGVIMIGGTHAVKDIIDVKWENTNRLVIKSMVGGLNCYVTERNFNMISGRVDRILRAAYTYENEQRAKKKEEAGA